MFDVLKSVVSANDSTTSVGLPVCVFEPKEVEQTCLNSPAVLDSQEKENVGNFPLKSCGPVFQNVGQVHIHYH